MGLDRMIRFPSAETPAWEPIRTLLLSVGETGQLRMIDNLPAFPDESPPDNWTELRLGTSSGMVTIRRGRGTLVCVIWGNGDAALILAWAKVIWACAAAGGGLVDSHEGGLTADQFAQTQGISPHGL